MIEGAKKTQKLKIQHPVKRNDIQRDKIKIVVRELRIFQSGAEGRHGPSKAALLGLFVNAYRSKTCVPLMH